MANRFNLSEQVRRWITSRSALIGQIDKLQAENKGLREKLAQIQHARDQADRSAEERRREKEALREKLADQKKELESAHLVNEQVSAKLAELRDEYERVKRSRPG